MCMCMCMCCARMRANTISMARHVGGWACVQQTADICKHVQARAEVCGELHAGGGTSACGSDCCSKSAVSCCEHTQQVRPLLFFLSSSSPSPSLLCLSSSFSPSLLLSSFSRPLLLLSFSSPSPLLLLSFSSPCLLLLLSFSSPCPVLLLSFSRPPSPLPLSRFLCLFFFCCITAWHKILTHILTHLCTGSVRSLINTSRTSSRNTCTRKPRYVLCGDEDAAVDDGLSRFGCGCGCG